jgi:hypothetical protein
MVDNIKLNKILPLLSSTERVKQVDRRQRNSQESPFNDTLKKKKKKKKDGENVEISEAALTEDSVQPPSHTGKKRSAKDKKSRDDQPPKIIDIRV